MCDYVVPAALNVFFDPVSFNMTEGGNVSLSVMVNSTNYSFPFSVSLSYKDYTAIDGVDYLHSVFTVDFSAEQDTATFEVLTFDDNVAELMEKFTVVIVNTTIPSKVMTGGADTASVYLIDNDGMPCSS